MYLSDNKEEFLKFPLELYADDLFYKTKIEDISQCEKIFVVKNEDKILARAGFISVNPSQIAFFEAENDTQAVNFLFDKIKEYAKSKGCNYLIGPINGSTWKKYRITLPSNNPPFLLDNYNKDYYSMLFENYGFETIANYKSTICKNLDRDYSRLDKFGTVFENKGIKIRKFDIENFDKDIKKIYDVSIKSFVSNFLYTPIEFEEFYKMYEPVKSFLNPEWVLIAEDASSAPIAFIFGFDNLYSLKEKSLIIKTLAQIPDYKYRGIGSYLVELIHKKASILHYDNIIHALMHKDNVSSNILKGDIYHEYKLYGVKL